MLTRFLSLGAGAGLVVGLVLGYLVWGRESSALVEELARTKIWLHDEIKRADAATQASQTPRAPSDGGSELQRVQAGLRAAQADLNATRGLLKEAVDDWKTERKRRRDLEVRLAAKENECPEARRPRR